MKIPDHFSPDYQRARQRFLSAADDAGATVEHLPHPEKGPGGEALYTDVTRLGSRAAQQTLVLVSGTHGVEGFAGSAIQSAFLRGGGGGRLGAEQALVLVHALNPFGFAHLRRVTEENVDLNRNFPSSFDAPPTNEGYDRLAEAVFPDSFSIWSEARSRLAFLRYRLAHGRPELQRALSGGQYGHPEGLFYGGQGPTWSHRTFRDIVRRHLQGAREVTLIDLHTGLGAYGAADLILVEPPSSIAYARAREIWGGRVRSTADGTASSAPVEGTLLHALPRMLPEAQVLAGVLECGTLPPKEVFLALRRENLLWHRGDRKAARGVLLPAFQPDGEDWKKAVLQAGLEVAERGLVAAGRGT